MSELSIWPINLGVNPGGEKSGQTHGMNLGVEFDGALKALFLE